MTKIYYHHPREGDLSNLRKEEEKHIYRDQEQPVRLTKTRAYGGRKVLVVEIPKYWGVMDNQPVECSRGVQVAGLIVGKYRTKNEHGVLVTEVEPITDNNTRRELTDLLRSEGEKAPIGFWDP